MRRVFLSVLSLMILALAGCAEEASDASDDPVADDGSPADDGDANQTAPGGTDDPDGASDADVGNATNTPPSAELSADVRNGTAPLNVTFTVDGSDADGDNLTWTLELNGTELAAGDTLPADADTTLQKPGNHTITLTVDDGNATAQAAVTIQVRAAQQEAPEPELQATWTGLVWDPSCVVQDGHSVPGDFVGMEYRVTAGWADGMYMDFWDAAISSQVGTSDTQVGIIPEGTGNAWLCVGDSNSPGEYTIEIWG